MLGERLIHLDPPEVTGYVMDGIAASMGARTTEFPYYSNWDTDFGEVADRFLAMCQDDEEIAARFKKRGLAGTIKHLIATFDKDPYSICAVIISLLYDDFDTGTTNPAEAKPPSFTLRLALGTMLSDSEMRKLIPPVVYRLYRCTQNDQDILLHVIQVLEDFMNAKIEDEAYQSLLLFNIIISSEMWEIPSPSVETIKKRFTDVLMSDTGIYTSTELYCACSKEKSKACEQFQTGKYDANPIILSSMTTMNTGTKALLSLLRPVCYCSVADWMDKQHTSTPSTCWMLFKATSRNLSRSNTPPMERSCRRR
ncbi:hypothetical protein P3T76_006806 [Phytophthora citrophthora]|uniref:Uncharacterized protein n=1 Tax=Phytophthora citrophthora TaxID=4793 RepID=A0AAD9GNJ1_9STRA|nr:hypothetical protein P3T76_006806 [Phytophthora citrophthora]